jgi:hypothetical protein
MIYLLAFFCSPLALLLIGRWFQAIFNLVLYVIAILLTLTIVFWAPAGLIVWGIGVLHAVLSINAYKADRRNREMIKAMQDRKS